MEYPILTMIKNQLNNEVDCIFVDENGLFCGEIISLTDFLEICGLQRKGFPLPKKGRNCYEQFVVFQNIEYLLYYSNDIFGFDIRLFPQKIIDYSPILYGTNYIFSTFKNSR